MKNIYYDYTKLMSYNASLNIIIGERGVGKSYGIKKIAIKKFLKTGKQFIYLRRYNSELEEALKDNNFFKDIRKDPDFKNVNFKTIGNELYVNDKVCGYGVALSTATMLKSIPFPLIDLIIYDEFLIEEDTHHYLKNEPRKLFDFIETVFRLRTVKVYMLGNNISVVNPYFEYLNIYVPYNSTMKLFNDGTILVNYIKNLKYREEKEKSSLGKLIKNTEYASYNINNKALLDNRTFISKKDKNSKIFCNLIIDNVKYGVWIYGNKMYISTKYNVHSRLNFTLDKISHNTDNILISKNNVFFKNITKHYEIGLLYFENQTIKQKILNIIHKSKNWI